MSFHENDVNRWYEYYCMASNWSALSKKEVIEKFVNVLNTERTFVKKNFNCKLDVPYGQREREKIDFIYPKGVDENQIGLPVLVFIHGGYWEEGDPSFYNGFAKPYLDKNCVIALVGYNLSSSTIKIPYIEKQCVEALKFINVKFPSSKLILTGHSAGAYLATAMFSHQCLVDSIHALIPLAGCYDLHDLTKTSISKAVNLETLDEQNLIQRHLLLSNNHKIFIFVGQNDSPYLLMQSLKFYEKLSSSDENNSNKNKNNVNFEVIRNEDHFSLIENCILNKDFPVTACIIGLIKELNKMLK